VPLPTHQRPCGDLFGGEQNHPEYDPARPAGYETASTGFMMVGAREYDPEIGRFLQPDPQPTGPDLQWGQLNRWAYCANDPVNASDPSGEYLQWLFGLGLTVGMGVGVYIGFSLTTRAPVSRLGALVWALVAVLSQLLVDSVNCGGFGGTHPWQRAFAELLAAIGFGAAYGVSLIRSATALGMAGVFMLGGFIIGLALGMALGSVAGAVYGSLSASTESERDSSWRRELEPYLMPGSQSAAVAYHWATAGGSVGDPPATTRAEVSWQA